MNWVVLKRMYSHNTYYGTWFLALKYCSASDNNLNISDRQKIVSNYWIAVIAKEELIQCRIRLPPPQSWINQCLLVCCTHPKIYGNRAIMWHYGSVFKILNIHSVHYLQLFPWFCARPNQYNSDHFNGGYIIWWSSLTPPIQSTYG